jgi:gentisate 1,2-dioxygenase
LFESQRIRAETGPVVIRADEIPWFQNRQASRIKYLLTPQKTETGLQTMEVFVREDANQSGMHRHQGGLVIYVLEGTGHTVVDGVAYHWEPDDLLLLPLKPGGVAHQHFNDTAGRPSRWLAFIVNAFRDHLGNEMVQIVDAPSWRPEQAQAAVETRPAQASVNTLRVPEAGQAVVEGSTIFDQLFALRDAFRRRARAGVAVVKGKDLAWENSRQGRVKWLLHPFQDATVMKSLLVYVQEIPPGSRSGKQRCPGGTVQYVIQGRGHSIIDGVREEWKAGDCIALPIRPNGVEFQHFNDDLTSAVRLVSATPNLIEVLGPDMGSEFEQLEDAPDSMDRPSAALSA